MKRWFFQGRAVLSPESGTERPFKNRAEDSPALKNIFRADLCLSATRQTLVSEYRDLWHPINNKPDSY